MRNVAYFRSQQLDEFIWRAEQAGAGWLVPLLRAARRGDLQLLMAPAGGRLPLGLLKPAKHSRPTVVVLGDDAGPSAGPAAFPQARRLFRWASWVMLHSAGGEPWHYACAAEAATLMRRALVVETSTAGLPAWVALKNELAPETPGICFQVPEGRPPHPVHGLGQTVQ